MVETLGKKNMAAISVRITNISILFLLLHTFEISQGTEYEYELFVSHRYMPEIRLLFMHVIRFILGASCKPSFVKRKID
jgi:hypothetical protein